MQKNEFMNKLSSLYADLTLTNDKAVELLTLINDTNCDKKDFFTSLYFSENSPIRTINLTFSPGGKKDYTGEMLRLSMNYDQFVRKMYQEAQSIIINHDIAVTIFAHILSMPYPYSQILYFKYFKKMTSEEVRQKLYLTKTTYYRVFDKAVSLAYSTYEKEKK